MERLKIKESEILEMEMIHGKFTAMLRNTATHSMAIGCQKLCKNYQDIFINTMTMWMVNEVLWLIAQLHDMGTCDMGLSRLHQVTSPWYEYERGSVTPQHN